MPDVLTFTGIVSFIAFVSTVLAIINVVNNLKRNKTTDTKQEAVEMTRIIFQLETIAKDTTEIKNTIKDLKSEVKGHSETLIKHDEQIKAIWRRVDELRENMEVLNK